jgi:N12 class adenine-specific DNA methylase
MYTMQRFLDPEGLRSRGLEHFDAWAATFGEVIDTMEISPLCGRPHNGDYVA